MLDANMIPNSTRDAPGIEASPQEDFFEVADHSFLRDLNAKQGRSDGTVIEPSDNERAPAIGNFPQLHPIRIALLGQHGLDSPRAISRRLLKKNHGIPGQSKCLLGMGRHAGTRERLRP